MLICKHVGGGRYILFHSGLGLGFITLILCINDDDDEKNPEWCCPRGRKPAARTGDRSIIYIRNKMEKKMKMGF